MDDNKVKTLQKLNTLNLNSLLRDRLYRAGYMQAIEDIIEYMDKGDLDDYVDPYEIGGFMLCLKNAGDKLIKEL